MLKEDISLSMLKQMCCLNKKINKKSIDGNKMYFFQKQKPYSTPNF